MVADVDGLRWRRMRGTVEFVENLCSRDDGCGRRAPNGRALAGHLLAAGSTELLDWLCSKRMALSVFLHRRVCVQPIGER